MILRSRAPRGYDRAGSIWAPAALVARLRREANRREIEKQYRHEHERVVGFRPVGDWLDDLLDYFDRLALTVSVLQQVSTDDINTNAGLGVTLTVSAGSYLHCSATVDSVGGITFTGIVSSPSLTWTLLDNINDAGNAQRVAHWVSSVTSAGSITVTPTQSGNKDARGTTVKEIGGSSGYDSTAGAHHGNQQASPTTTTDATTSGSTPALTAQPALVSGFCMSTGSATTPAAGTGFSSDGTGWLFGGGTNYMRGESKRVTATTAVDAKYTAGVNLAHTTLVAAFLEAGAGAAASDPPGGGRIPTALLCT